MKKKLLLAGAVALLAAAAVTGSTAYSKTNVSELLNANVEALARGEQPDVNECLYDPSMECWALHPSDPDKDIIRRDSRW